MLVSANMLHQQICLTAIDQFEATRCECNLYGFDVTKDKQISSSRKVLIDPNTQHSGRIYESQSYKKVNF